VRNAKCLKPAPTLLPNFLSTSTTSNCGCIVQKGIKRNFCWLYSLAICNSPSSSLYFDVLKVFERDNIHTIFEQMSCIRVT
jgi:hypothetical protein